jgi:SAM-dependent methyltransferase
MRWAKYPREMQSPSAADTWAGLVRANREQRERCGEADARADYYKPVAQRFAQDPFRTDEPALDALLELARARDTWLDIGAGAGRYALPLALKVREVIAVEPSLAMLDVLHDGMKEHAIDNISVHDASWPVESSTMLEADVALIAHVGYDVEDFAAFLDAAEASARKHCVVVMRQSSATSPGPLLWEEVHGEPRFPLPILPELVALLMERGVRPQITLVGRWTWGYGSRDELLGAARRQLWLQPDSEKDQHLQRIIAERATEQDGDWALDWSPMRDGIVSWKPSR